MNLAVWFAIGVLTIDALFFGFLLVVFVLEERKKRNEYRKTGRSDNRRSKRQWDTYI